MSESMTNKPPELPGQAKIELNGVTQVKIVDIDIPISSLIPFLIKLSVSLIPVSVLFSIIYFFLGMAFR